MDWCVFLYHLWCSPGVENMENKECRGFVMVVHDILAIGRGILFGVSTSPTNNAMAVARKLRDKRSHTYLFTLREVEILT